MSRIPTPRTLSSPYIVAMPAEMAGYTGLSVGTSAWPAANRALYVPLFVPSTQRLKTVSVWCAATGSGTFDLGLYDGLGTTLLGSMGSTALVATSVNTWTPTNPILVEAGVRYYLGMSASSATSTFVRVNPNVSAARGGGLAQQATAHPLPSTATPAQVASAYAPVFALTFV